MKNPNEFFDFTIQHFYGIIELKTNRYATKIEYVDGKGGGTASFTTPNGTYESVQLYDYRIVYTDEDKSPKLIKYFFIVFETEDHEKIQLNVPEEFYPAFEKGQNSLLTLVNGELYSFEIDEE